MTRQDEEFKSGSCHGATLTSASPFAGREDAERRHATVAHIVQLEVKDLIGQPEERFQAVARRIMEKNAELYRRLA